MKEIIEAKKPTPQEETILDSRKRVEEIVGNIKINILFLNFVWAISVYEKKIWFFFKPTWRYSASHNYIN